jgi:hypothetical protein
VRFARRPRSGRADLALQNYSFADRRADPYQSVFTLTDRTWALQNRMSVIPKKKKDPESGLFTLFKSFIFNNMAERVGFEPTLPFRVNTLSKRAPSATRPSLRLSLSQEAEALGA